MGLCDDARPGVGGVGVGEAIVHNIYHSSGETACVVL